ncbi:hypothetical protein M408DRAFT_24437 [Serendipita vermifera MAFF 305830]|uniref:Uncharacterized protein n=1 Tax=Serendipita vermifera MAFF 305830 TaxID=933852 RepID=A0A0C3B7R7_SERVB|nr:hypothetical protein M408DRAFT_24437 [Serendipita vermifera MAFF 305830]
MDVWDEGSQSFQSVAIPSPSNGRDVGSDAALPPLYGGTNVTFHVFLDLEHPLSVPRWVKTGDVDDWLQTIFGAPLPGAKGVGVKQEDGSESALTKGWEGKISVMDPDPAPTLQNVLETWATNSIIAQQKDRELFLKSHLYLQEKAGDDKKEHDMDNVLEILLRMIRNDRPLIGAAPDGYHHHHHHHHNNANSVHPILQAAVGSDPSLIMNQTHPSLAVLAMFRMLQQTALKYGGKEAKREVDDQVREIIKSLPPHLINKALDGMFQKWLATHGGPGSSKGGGAGKGHR